MTVVQTLSPLVFLCAGVVEYLRNVTGKQRDER